MAKYILCSWCGTEVRWGLFVCLGCHSDLVYGVTGREITAALVLGFLFGPPIVAFTYGFIGSQFPYIDLSAAKWLAFGILSAPALSVGLTILRWWWHRGTVRFFRRRSF
jgi:hypothetical protein